VPAVTVAKVAEDTEYPWNHVTLGNGAKGPIVTHDKCVPVYECRDGKPVGKKIWLYIRKLESEEGKVQRIKFSLCNAPETASETEIRKPALMRWSIEQCFEECKLHLGMDQCEARSWNAWHRHILLTLIAHLFVIKYRLAHTTTMRKPSPGPYIVLPTDTSDVLDAAANIAAGKPVEHPGLLAMPNTPQQVLTIGNVLKLINTVLHKNGNVMQQIDRALYSDASAYDSHSKANLNQACKDLQRAEIFDITKRDGSQKKNGELGR